MAGLTVICALLALAALGDAIIWESIKVKFGLLMDGMYDIPLGENDIKDKEFVYLENHAVFPSATLFCYPQDPRVCPIYDSHGHIAGLRVAYIKDDLKIKSSGDLPYSFNKHIFQQGSAYGKEFYYIDVLFISPASLGNGGPSVRPEPVGTGVYFNSDGITWTEVPRREQDVDSTMFKRQGCVPGVGTYYFHGMTAQMRCEDHLPPFLLYDGGELTGLGLVSFGSFTGTPARTWFENPVAAVVQVIAPQSPPCLKQWVSTYGATSLHIFFKKGSALTCSSARRFFSKSPENSDVHS